MSHVKEENIGPIPRDNITDNWTIWYQWLDRLSIYIPRERHYTVSFTPVSVVANTSVEQLLMVPGVTLNDTISVNPPIHVAGILVGSPRVSAANTIMIPFSNSTGLGVVPPIGDYKIMASRQ